MPIRPLADAAVIDITWLVGVLVVALGALIQWWMRRIESDMRGYQDETKRDIDAIGTRLNTHQLSVAERYVSRETLREFLGQIESRLRDLSDGQDRIFQKLDGKADRNANGGGHD